MKQLGNQKKESDRAERGVALPQLGEGVCSLLHPELFEVKFFSFVPQGCGLGPGALGGLAMMRRRFGGGDGHSPVLRGNKSLCDRNEMDLLSAM